MAPQQPHARKHAAGGWRRALIGLLAGASLGMWVTRVVPPDRTWPPAGWRRGWRA